MGTPKIDYRRNPKLFKELLCNVCSEIAAEIRNQDFTECLKGICKEEIDKPLALEMKQDIEEFFVEEDLENKVSYLMKQSDEADSKAPAWRPTTGTVNREALDALVLQEKKEYLTKKIEKEKQRIDELEFYIKEMRSEMSATSEVMMKFENIKLT